MPDSSYISDAEFFVAIENEDDKRIGQMYKMVFPPVLSFILKNNGDEHDAKDIYQEAFIIALRQIQSNKFLNKSSVKTYLYSIARNLWLKELKKRGIKLLQIHETEEVLVIENPMEDKIAYDKKIQAMEKSLQDLGEPCTTILSDFYLNRLNMDQIKEKMGYTNTANAKNQKYKCLQRLKKVYFGIYSTRVDE